MKNRLLLIISVYLASIATPSFADSSTEGNAAISQSETTKTQETTVNTKSEDKSSANDAKSETTKTSSSSDNKANSSSDKTSVSGSKSDSAKMENSSSSTSETSATTINSPKTATLVSEMKTETVVQTPKTGTTAPVVNTSKVETPAPAANPVSEVKTETVVQTPKTGTTAPVVNTSKVETPAPVANPMSEVKTETSAQTSKIETVTSVVNTSKVETPAPAANPVSEVKTETVVQTPKTGTTAPVVNTSKVETPAPAANPVSEVKTETATQTPKVETPVANSVRGVKAETAAQTPKVETTIPVVNTPKVETPVPSANPTTAVSAPNIPLSAPAPNPTYIAPKDEKAAADTANTKTETVKNVTPVEETKPVLTDIVFIAKDDVAKTCPNTPAIIDIGSNDEIVGTGSYRTTFKTNNGSSVSNNWDGYGKDGTVTYIPGKDFRGLDSFTYTIRDQNGKTSVATVSVDVSCDEAGFGSVSSCAAYAISDDYSLMPVVVHRTQLLKIDQNSGQVTAIGAPLPPKEGIEGLAISPITHTMYAISGGYAAKQLNGSLYRMNSSTGEIQLVGETGFKGTSSLAFRNDGSLWAWSEAGLISIDPSTAQASLVFSSDQDFEGLAWSSDGNTLYASKLSGLWAYDGTGVTRVCNNFPDEVEALETLDNGLLMYSLNQQHINLDSNALYVYDPKQCKVISSVPIGAYRDIESVAWAYDCQSHAASTSGTIKFEGAAETQMCLEPSQWLEVKGSVSLQPTTASAQLQTVWQVIEPPQPECPNGECKQAQVKSQVVTGSETPFYIKGWWDGLKKQPAVKLRYTARLLDMQGQALAGSTEVSKTLVATAEACGKAGSSLPAGAVGQPAADTNALQSYFKEMGLKQFSIDNHGKLSVTFDGKTHHGMFSYVIEQGSVNADQKLTLKAIPDANADGVDDFVVIYPNGQTQLLLYLGNQ